MTGQTMKSSERILFASTNFGKFEEVRAVLAGYAIVVISPEQYRAERSKLNQFSEYPVVDENGRTYEDNARKKADAFYAWAEIPSLGDDSGLEVKALSGAPGLYSARYAGPDATSHKNREKLLWALRDAVDRSAKICCSLCLRLDSTRLLEVEASLDCLITTEVRGNGGFGYDSLLEVVGVGKTLAELKEAGTAIKTHRELALDKLMVRLAAL
jgi:XTP/dITP diphosphohydrolase